MVSRLKRASYSTQSQKKGASSNSFTGKNTEGRKKKIEGKAFYQKIEKKKKKKKKKRERERYSVQIIID